MSDCYCNINEMLAKWEKQENLTLYQFRGFHALFQYFYPYNPAVTSSTQASIWGNKPHTVQADCSCFSKIDVILKI